MGQWLNRAISIFLFFIFSAQIISSQENSNSKNEDYKDQDQFKNFYKRRKLIGAWQINQLKTGALVVRLKTNKKQIEALNARGQTKQAQDKALETYVINKNTMRAYLNNYNFSKLYFILSSSSDSLLNGARTGIFLDTNLQVDPTIKMAEGFYLIAERDYSYNSSIGFVTQDSANFVKERGNPVREMGVVIKNKYGHQLKAPFPYIIKDKVVTALVPFVLPITVIKYVFQLIEEQQEFKKQHANASDVINGNIDKQLSYPNLAIIVSQLNINLREYYQATPPPDLSRVDPEIKKFLY